MGRKIVLTGAPGAGKTSLILALELRRETVVREAAWDTYLIHRARGIDNPFVEPKWEDCSLSLHLMRESRISHAERVAFLDRGAPDHVVFGELFGWPLSANLCSQALSRKYDLILLIELPRESTKLKQLNSHGISSLRIESALYDQYSTLGYSVKRIPYDSLDARVENIYRSIEFNVKTA